MTVPKLVYQSRLRFIHDCHFARLALSCKLNMIAYLLCCHIFRVKTWRSAPNANSCAVSPQLPAHLVSSSITRSISIQKRRSSDTLCKFKCECRPNADAKGAVHIILGGCTQCPSDLVKAERVFNNNSTSSVLGPVWPQKHGVVVGEPLLVAGVCEVTTQPSGTCVDKKALSAL